MARYPQTVATGDSASRVAGGRPGSRRIAGGKHGRAGVPSRAPALLLTVQPEQRTGNAAAHAGLPGILEF